MSDRPTTVGETRHEWPLLWGCAPVPDQEVHVLKAILTAACVLLLITAQPTAQATPSGAQLSRDLTRHVQSIRKSESVLRFFKTHAWLLDDARYRDTALRLVRQHERILAHEQARQAQVQQQRKRRLQALRREAAPPREAICIVFGSYCGQALRVALCESRYDVNAQNGQYLGLFQMGSHERSTYGHGSTPLAQARAAYRYFVASGRDWSPWECKPWW